MKARNLKVSTLAFLTGAGMLLTSVTVWSLTGPAPVGPEPTIATTTTSNPLQPQPFSGATFTAGRTVMLEGRLGHSVMNGNSDNETFVLLNMKAPNGAVTSTRAPLNLSIVLDRSGSMKGQKLVNAIAAARGMVDRLRDGDVVSIVTYSQSAEVVLAPVSIDSGSRFQVARALDNVEARGDTCISCGIDAAVELLRRRSGMVDRVLLLSDGEATAGVRDLEGFRSLASSLRRSGIAVTAIGVDVEYNERVMAALAQESNGHHFFVERPSDLARIFDQELENLVKTVAKDAELALEMAPGVDVVEIMDRSFRREGNRILVPVGSLADGEEKTVLARVRLPRSAEGARPILEARLTYQDLVNGVRGECAGTLSTLMTTDPRGASALDPLVSARLSRSETAATLNEANQLFSQGRVDEARKRLSLGLSKLEEKRDKVVAAAPKARASSVGSDLDSQADALKESEAVFASPPPAAEPGSGSAGPSREGAAQVRRNQERSVGLGF
jgi:Ca-activated chloride channel homolog